MRVACADIGGCTGLPPCRLLAIKRVPLQQDASVALQFEAPREGKHTLKMSLICDSYLGCDQEYEVELNVKPGEEEEEEEAAADAADGQQDVAMAQ